MKKENDNSAFPLPDIYYPNGDIEYGSGGLTKREYAAIHLRVPQSGNEELDAMIREAQRNELASRAMEGLVSQLNLYHVSVDEVAELSYRQADAMLKEREK